MKNDDYAEYEWGGGGGGVDSCGYGICVCAKVARWNGFG